MTKTLGAAYLRRRADRAAQRRFASRAVWAQRAMRDEFVEVGGFPVLDAGQGDVPIVLVPTFAELGFVYADMIDALSAGTRVITYLPTVSHRKPFGPSERADEAFAVLDALGVHRADYVAWSDAGSVLTEMAVQDPGRVRRAVYVGTPGAYRLPGVLDPLARLYVRTPVGRITPNLVAAGLIAWFLGGRRLASRDLLGHVRALGPVSGYLRYSILPCLLYSNLERVQERPPASAPPPALVIGGDSDRLVTTAEQRTLAEAWGGQFECITGGDHFMPFTATDVVVESVARFLGLRSEVRRSAS